MGFLILLDLCAAFDNIVHIACCWQILKGLVATDEKLLEYLDYYL